MGGRVHGVVSAGAVSGWDGVDGDAADAAVLRAGSDRRTALGAVDALRDAASVARSGASVIQAARQLVLGAVNAAEAAGFHGSRRSVGHRPPDRRATRQPLSLEKPSSSQRTSRFRRLLWTTRATWRPRSVRHNHVLSTGSQARGRACGRQTLLGRVQPTVPRPASLVIEACDIHVEDPLHRFIERRIPLDEIAALPG